MWLVFNVVITYYHSHSCYFVVDVICTTDIYMVKCGNVN